MHLIKLLEGYEGQTSPIDYYVSRYFREHHALGSKDRAFISEEVYRLIRWKGLVDFVLQEQNMPISWKARLDVMPTLSQHLSREDIPLHIRVSMPKELFCQLVRSWGHAEAEAIALASNEQAPTFVRVNALKTTRDDLLARWQSQDYAVSKGQECDDAILFHKKIHFFSLPEFREGLFEVQDEGSQLVAKMCAAKSHEQVLDFCAGSGGKALAFAPQMGGTGQIYLHDVRKHALIEAKKRLKRAGIQNAQIVHAEEHKKLKSLKKTMDWVIVDAPCSGSGTLRRNPDMKWKYTDEMLERLVSEQRVIFEQALSYVRPEGMILYATCSILSQENQEQVEHFLKTYPIEQVGPLFACLPERGKKDGFFACLFQKKGGKEPLIQKMATYEYTDPFSLSFDPHSLYAAFSG